MNNLVFFRAMLHLKGTRFGFPMIRRAGVMKHLGVYPVKWQTHNGAELHFVLKGSIAWEIEGLDRPLGVSGGCFAVIPPGARHRALDVNGSPAVRLGMILEPPAPGLGGGSTFTDADIARAHGILAAAAREPRRMSARLLANVRELSESLDLEAVAQDSGRLHLRTISSAVLDEALRLLSSEKTLAPGGDVIPKIAAWIDAHCCEEISPDRLVRLSGYGRSRFFSLFLGETGMTPRDYIVRSRIAAAKRMLAESGGRTGVCDVALRCGFASASSFSTVFRKHVGKSPRDFRRDRLVR